MYLSILCNRGKIILPGNCGYFLPKCFECVYYNELSLLDVCNLLKKKVKLLVKTVIWDRVKWTQSIKVFSIQIMKTVVIPEHTANPQCGGLCTGIMQQQTFVFQIVHFSDLHNSLSYTIWNPKKIQECRVVCIHDCTIYWEEFTTCCKLTACCWNQLHGMALDYNNALLNHHICNI